MTSAKNMFTKPVISKPEEKLRENLLVQVFKKNLGEYLILITNELTTLEHYTNQCRTLFLVAPATTDSETKLSPVADTDSPLPNKKSIDAIAHFNTIKDGIKKLVHKFLCDVIYEPNLSSSKIKSPRTAIRDQFLIFENHVQRAIPLITSEEVYRTTAKSHEEFCDLVIAACDDLFLCIHKRAETILAEIDAITATESKSIVCDKYPTVARSSPGSASR